jgi:hypothetical protein
VASGISSAASWFRGNLRGVPDAPGTGLHDDRGVSPPRRFLVDVEVRDSEIAGSVTDEAGQVRRFVGWLALIAALQPPGSPAHASGAPRSPSDDA